MGGSKNVKKPNEEKDSYNISKDQSSKNERIEKT